MRDKRRQKETGGLLLCRRRKAVDLSLRRLRDELEKRCGLEVSFQHLSKVERSESVPSIDLAAALEVVLDIPLDAWCSEPIRRLREVA